MNNFSSFFFTLESIFWVIIFFGGSIFVHEFGHFIAAKRRKLFVPRFSIGFGPRLFSKTIGGTEFCISLFPFGGYVALPQLMEAKELEGKYDIPPDRPPISWIDKIIVSAMGAVFNVLFAFVLATILWKTGMEQSQNTTNNIIGYIKSEVTLANGERVISPAKAAGLKIGDQIIAIDGIQTHNLNDIIHGVALGEKRDALGPLSTVTILREGKCQDFTVHPVLLEQNRRSKESLRIMGIETFQELFISSIFKNTPAERAGLQKGDKLLSINGEKLFSFSQFNDILEREKEFQLTVERDGKEITIPLSRENISVTCPFLKITTAHGTFEASPIFTHRDAIVDPHGDECTLQLLSMESEFQEKFPQWKIGDAITHLQRKPVHNIADSSFIFQNAIDRVVTLTLNNQDYPISIRKAELIPSEQYCSIGVDLCGTHILVHQNPFSLIGEGARLTFLTLKSLLSPASDVHFKNLMGPPGILDTLYTLAGRDLRLLLWLVILLNVNLAIFNLLPIPILDGGVIALTLLEKIFRRKIASRILAAIQLTCMIFFLGLMLYVSFFDINRIMGKKDMKKIYHKQQQLFIDEQLLWNGLKSS
ncbi:MAG: RIP metalloprotease RseP [Puniceicoccales bacterium]|jgi:RIP metalloprotease RseP|nr:RIP metalloprotease RseP [Puniceicoccales bacterium]